ncbi:hypothetical protein E5161_01295 [Cohnella pontilimi]|uniref:Uncharacterized protein n=1 Tax=Cohnella pontilimi TaxID=2564100 RepID=A0A4U0FGL1_9BACL|nr:hypothetical protein [Cohnella pontilimi]TJY44061.1 hypothetical protein E5161_01295 [Cohnella pontilimi]
MILPQQKANVILNKLVVNVIEDTSGIFIGTNQAWGWSSCGKSNYGFGVLKNSCLTRSLSIVQDSDIVDAPVQDIRHIALTEQPNSVQQASVAFQSLRAESLNNGSAIGLGENIQLGWRSTRKNNYGGGKHQGINHVNRMANITFDNDGVDAPVQTAGTILDTSPVVKNIRITQENPE